MADAGNKRIVRIDDMTGAGWTTLGGPTPGRGTNQFTDPRGFFVDPAVHIYVVDFGNHRTVWMNDLDYI